MSVNSLSGVLESVALALGNHLWQSTLVAGVIALLSLALRKNRAQVRYWLWLVASMKFLVPFSLLMIVGGHFASLLHSTPQRQAAAESFVTIEQISQPFTNTPDFYGAQRPAAPAARTSISDRLAAIWNREPLLPVALACAWLIGFLVVTTRWTRRWLRIATAIQQTAPLHEGREFETLQTIRRLAGLRQSIELRSLPASMEPGIFGIFRPVLLWPQAITERLEDTHLEAVVAHEVCHVRRWDNLTAAIHMLVEAIFWFHPLVWWLEGRLVAERERACDEEVLQLCRQHRIYAESILKICEFCIETPLACVSGVTGADLKKRITQIMNGSVGCELGFGRRCLLLGVALIAVTVPIVLGQAKAAQKQTFEVASIHPFDPHVLPGNSVEAWVFPSNRFNMKVASLKTLINIAYGINRISGGPDWVDSQRYSVSAKVEGDTLLTQKEMQPLLQNLLEERFHLRVHRVQNIVPGYALVVAKGGPKLQPTKGGPFRGIDSLCELKFHNDSVENFAKAVGHYSSLSKPVVDRTGLEGMYDFDLKFVPEDSPYADAPSCSGVPDIFTAVQLQLGLKLVPQKVPVDSLVIDSVEKPSEN